MHQSFVVLNHGELQPTSFMAQCDRSFFTIVPHALCFCFFLLSITPVSWHQNSDGDQVSKPQT